VPSLAARGATPSPVLAFVLIAAAFGSVLAILSPPMHWGDENTHFVQAYRVSELHFATAVENDHLMVSLPRGVHRLLLVLALERHVNQRNGVRFSVAKLAGRRQITADPHDRRTVGLANATYPPLAYAPQALGIAVARPFTSSVLGQLYAARLANLLAWLVLVATAIHVAPVLKLPLAALALAPMSVFVAATLAVDGLTSGLAFLWSACVMRLAAGARVSRRRLLALGLLAVALALVKIVYAPLILLLLVVPAERLGGRRSQLVCVAGMLLASLACLAAWLAYARSDIAQHIAYRGGDAARANLSLLLSDPIGVGQLVVETVAHDGEHWLLQLIDTHWGAPRAPRGFAMLWLATVAAALLADPCTGRWPSPRQRLVAGALVVLTFCGVILCAFLFWSPAAAGIDGVQGRYLLPLLPALAIALCAPARLALPERLRGGIGVLVFVVLAAMLAHTVHRGTGLYAWAADASSSERPRVSGTRSSSATPNSGPTANSDAALPRPPSGPARSPIANGDSIQNTCPTTWTVKL
jgi:uncharacterized membrane protein